MTGSMMTIIPMVPLRKRPLYQSMFGAAFGIASLVGPLIGGALAERVTWRWCFYLNLPVGGIAMIFLFLFLNPPKKSHENVSIAQHILRLDPLGTHFFIPSIVSLILALQWGGSTYAWSSWCIILLLVAFVVAGLAFAAVQVMMPESVTLPLRIISQRTVIAATWYLFFLAAVMIVTIYYVPLWFQTTHGVSPFDSGIYSLPLVLSPIFAAVASGAVTQVTGYYVPSMIAASCLMAIGSGLMTTFTPATDSSHWVGYHLLVGFGIGAGLMAPSLAVQTVLPMEDVPTGVSITFFVQQVGGAIFVSVGQTILSTMLVRRLANIPGLGAQTVINAGATELASVVPAEFRATVAMPARE